MAVAIVMLLTAGILVLLAVARSTSIPAARGMHMAVAICMLLTAARMVSMAVAILTILAVGRRHVLAGIGWTKRYSKKHLQDSNMPQQVEISSQILKAENI